MTHRARTLVLAATLLALPAAAFAGSIQAIEGTLNTVFQKEQTSFSGIGVRVHMAGPAAIPGMSLVPTLQYWSSKNDMSEFGFKSQRSDAMMGIEARYNWKSSLLPYAGMGYGIHFMDDQVTSTSTGDQSKSLSKGAISLLGGISVPLAGKLHNDFGGQYFFLGDRAQFKLDWGFRYEF